ncbi:MAG: hypothetical protein ACI3YC_08750 [Alloprevotella sp.]
MQKFVTLRERCPKTRINAKANANANVKANAKAGLSICQSKTP